MAAHAAGDQHVYLALDELVQAGRLQHAQTDLCTCAAKLCQLQAAQVDAAVDSQVQQHRACRLQLRGRLGDVTKTLGYPGQIGLAGFGQDELLVQPLEQLHAEPGLQRFHLLPHGGGRDVQLVRRQLEAEMARGGFEGADGVERGQGVGHRICTLTPMERVLAIDFLALNRSNDALR